MRSPSPPFVVLGAAFALTIGATCTTSEPEVLPSATSSSQGGSTSSSSSSSSSQASGGGGTMQIPSEEAMTPEECEYLGVGGADLSYCDYVTVLFSEDVPTADLEITVDTSLGDQFTLSGAGADPSMVHLELVAGASSTDAAGFAIVKQTDQPHYSPDEVDVLVTLGQQTIADTEVQPTYTCVEITGDDWCWKGDPVTITVTP